MTAELYELSLVPLLIGIAMFAVLVFIAGWVARGEYDLYQRATGRSPRRRVAEAGRSWPPW